MAVHVNRNLADNQSIAAIGIIHNEHNEPFLLAESLNPMLLTNEDNQPPLLLIALPESEKKAGEVAQEMAKNYQYTANITKVSKNKGVKKTDGLAHFRDNAASSLSSNEVYAARQLSNASQLDNNKNSSYEAIFASKTQDMVKSVLGDEYIDTSTPADALNKISNLTASGRKGHIFRAQGLVLTSHDANAQNVFDGYTVELPNPDNPSKPLARQVVTATALALKPIFSPRSAIRQIENEVDNIGALHSEYDTSEKERMVFATKRVMMGDTHLMSAQEAQLRDLDWSKDSKAAADIEKKSTGLAKAPNKGYVAISSNVAVKNEVPLALSHIPSVADPDSELRTTGIRQFHTELGKAISEYHQAHLNTPTHHKDLMGLNTGLVLDVWSKTPTEAGKDGVKNGYKTRQGFGMYVDLPDKTSSRNTTAEARTQSITDQLTDIVHLRDQATLDYLGERKESAGGRPPTFDYSQSKHSKLTEHFRNLIKSEIGALRVSVGHYVESLDGRQLQSPENQLLKNINEKPEAEAFEVGEQMLQILRANPTIAKRILNSANLEQATQIDIQRTTNALTDIEKKYAANTGLRAIFLAEREENTGPIVLNPNDEKFGSIQAPEWFHKGPTGMRDKYFEKLLPTKQLTTHYMDHDNHLDKVTVTNLPRASSVYGEIMKDMASLRHNDLQTPELQKQRILTHPTFQIATVKRWNDLDSAPFNEWYNGSEMNAEVAYQADKSSDNKLMRYAGYLEQVQPIARTSGKNARNSEKQILEDAGLTAMAASFGNKLSMGNVLTEVEHRLGTKLESQISASVFNRNEKLYTSSFGYATTNPIAAYKPHLIGNKGGSLIIPLDNSPGSFQNLEGIYPPAFAPGIHVEMNPGASFAYRNIDRTDYRSEPKLISLNPLNDLEHINAALSHTSRAIDKMFETKSPALPQLAMLSKEAKSPLAHVENLQYAFFTMQKDKNDVSNAITPESVRTQRQDQDQDLSRSHKSMMQAKIEQSYEASGIAPTQQQIQEAYAIAEQNISIDMPAFDAENEQNTPENKPANQAARIRHGEASSPAPGY